MFYPVIFISLLVFHVAFCAEDLDDGDFALVRIHALTLGTFHSTNIFHTEHKIPTRIA